MRRLSIPILILGCLAALMLACYGRALFRGEQFGYRDAAHFYYPLHQRVQAEWHAGRWPLWEPEENSGMPLLGNPTAAVLYPGKLIFAAVSYPLGARLYVIGHTLLAFGAMLALLRSWETSWTGSALGAIAYAFGGPILFQYCNIIYLVGAAWVPLGVRAVDRWLRLGRRGALAELAVVLAMETLGGEPESAYLTGLCAAGYAVALAWGKRGRASLDARRCGIVVASLLLLMGVWVAGTLAMAEWAPVLRPLGPAKQPGRPLPWMAWVRPMVPAAWGVVGLLLLVRWRRLRQRKLAERPVLVPMLIGLGAAAVLAGAVSAAQLFPVLEFTGQSGRASSEGTHEIYTFSLHPLRVVEFLWPNLFGTPFHGNRLWLNALPPAGMTPKVWVPTLYVGGLTLVLALCVLKVQGAAPWRTWMMVVTAVSLVGSFGEYGSPIWLARLAPNSAGSIGPRDPHDVAPIRSDRYLRDGDGGFYWFLATVLPGFRQFRFPSKLLTFTVLGLTALAGQGWDALAAGEPRVRGRAAAWAGALLALSVAALAFTVMDRAAIVSWLEAAKLSTEFGPFDARGALAETQRGLVQAALVFAVALAIAVLMGRHACLAAALALVVMTADLAFANSRFIVTVPQSLMDSTPEVVSVIKRAEKENPAPGPYRVHRVPIWGPISRQNTPSSDRTRDFVEWERATIQPKYGLAYGTQYTMTLGVAELYDYEWYFGGFRYGARADAAQFLGVKPGTEVVVFPRRAYDMWNSRYFVLPYVPVWEDEHRGIASFLDRTERVYPPPDAFRGPDGKAKELDWGLNHDYQVRRNLDVYPRAWIVHEARTLPALRGLGRDVRKLPMEEIVFSDDLFWHDSTRTVYDPWRYVWLEEDERPELGSYVRGGYPSQAETVRVLRYEPDRVELEAHLERPGMVVLADIHYPGWSLTIDGRPAPIYRANRIMRGAAVTAGRHSLVYTYRPASFRVGLVVSCLGLAALGWHVFWSARSPLEPALAPDPLDLLSA